MDPDPKPDPTPDLTPFFIDFKDAQKIFSSYLFFNLAQRPRHIIFYFAGIISVCSTHFGSGSGRPKTCGSCGSGSGSPTLVAILNHTTRGNIYPHQMLHVLYSAHSRPGILSLGGPTLNVFRLIQMFSNKGGENLLKTWRGVAPPS